jgi:hypothetical protein
MSSFRFLVFDVICPEPPIIEKLTIRVNESTGKSLLTISPKPDRVGAACQPWILTGEQSGLLTRIATESVLLCARMKS